MGISQLLPFLANSTRPCNVSEFRGQTVAVDSYCWLHKGARSCAIQLAQGDQTDQYVSYCLRFVNMLLRHDIKPIMVFDGKHLNAKLKTEEKRKEFKRLAKKQAIEFLRLGQTSEAYKYFCQCIEVTPAMALALIKACRQIHVDCIVAPYEADAQLAFFSINHFVDCVITEDSDLLLFGCDKVLYKMDINGNGQLVESDKLHLSMKLSLDKYSFDKFLHMCILSGCDYLDSLPGIGLKKALKFVTLTVEGNPVIFLDRLPRYLKMPQLDVTIQYKKDFLIAAATFKHQIVFNPFEKKLVRLNAVDKDQDLMFCRDAGEFFEHEVAYELAIGNLNPLTLEKIDDWKPKQCELPRHSIWLENYRPRVSREIIYESPSPICKVATREQMETVARQHDEQIEREIEFYMRPTRSGNVDFDNPQPGPSSRPDVHPDPSSLPDDEEDSPVLNNPFVKKISKFSLTANPQRNIISPFFSHFLAPRESKMHYLSSSSSSSLENGSTLTTNSSLSSSLENCTSLSSTPDDSPESGIMSNSDSPWMEMTVDDVIEADADASEAGGSISVASAVCEVVLEDEAHGQKRKSGEESHIPAKKVKKQQTIQSMFMKMKMNSS